VSVVRVATRGSDLALAQSRAMAARIEKELGRETELVVITTSGDRIQDRALAEIGGKGLFIKEIEEALLEGRADVAVHSAKDLPAEIAEGLTLAAFPERADPRDALVCRDEGGALDRLPEGARVGTGSTRRGAQLREARPDLDIRPLRGNVPTRLAAIERDGLDAVVLACAGLDRLGLSARIHERLSPERLLPAVCQGVLALETRAEDPLCGDVARLASPEAATAAAAERGVLTRLGGDCTTPLAAFAQIDGERVRVRAWLADPEGRRSLADESTGAADRAEALGRELAERLLAAGGDRLLEAARGTG